MTMTFSDALLYSLLGVSVVFFALVLLIVIISIMNLFTQRNKKAAVPAAPAVTEPVAEAPAAEPEYAPGTAGELKLYDTDERDAAMIMAIVANELDAPLNELRFKSIRELK